MRVAEVMTPHVQTVPPGMRAPEAWELMRRRKIHHLVVTERSKVLGVVSDRDGDGPGGAVLRADSSVAEIMSDGVVGVESHESVRKAARLMRTRSIGCLPVFDGKRLVGIVTVSDVLDLVGRRVTRGATGHRRRPHRRHQRRAAPASPV